MTYYDEISKGYEELHAEEQLKKLKIIANELKLTKETKLLDVGCGIGLSAKVFSCHITGIDPSEELLKQCTFYAVQGKAENMPFAHNAFDVVIAVTSIHNFDDLEQGLKEIRRVGKKQFVLTILKKSPKKDQITDAIKRHFTVNKTIEEDKDIILFCS